MRHLIWLVALSGWLMAPMGCGGGGGGLLVSFTATPPAGPVPLTVTFKWQLLLTPGAVLTSRLDFGDGSDPYTKTPSSASESVEHTYTAVGQYTVTLRITDAEGNVQETSLTVAVQALAGNQPPRIESFTATPTSGQAPLQVTFNWNLSDPEGDALTSTLDFGDGSSPYTKPGSTASESTDHTYSTPGTYTVHLTVQDSAGNQAEQGLTITVQQAPAGEPPRLTNAKVEPTTLRFIGGAVTISAEVTDDGVVARVWAVITKPDGSTEEVEMGVTSGSTYTATWNAPGNARQDGQAETYGVVIHAKDNAGQETMSDGLSITVEATQPPPPAPSF